MNKRHLIIFSALALVGVVFGQGKPSTKAPNKQGASTASKKQGQAATTDKAANKPIVLGTTQLPGDFGRFGQTYTVGKSSPINFTLNRAEFTVSRFNVDQNSLVPTANQKLLVLHYTLHNPLPAEQRIYWGSGMRFTAVDSEGENHEFFQALVREGGTESVDMSLKPAQKLELVSVIPVPANAVVPKLIAQREDGAPVVRYDLRGKVQALPAPIADPADSTGSKALEDVPAQPGVFYPFGNMDIRLDTVSTTTEELGGVETPVDGRFVVFNCTIKNATGAEQRYYWGSFLAELKDVDGESVEWPQSILKSTRNEFAEGNLKPGAEYKIRFFFPLASGVKPKTFRLKEDESRAYSFTISLP